MCQDLQCLECTEGTLAKAGVGILPVGAASQLEEPFAALP